MYGNNTTSFYYYFYFYIRGGTDRVPYVVLFAHRSNMQQVNLKTGCSRRILRLEVPLPPLSWMDQHTLDHLRRQVGECESERMYISDVFCGDERDPMLVAADT